MNIGGAEALFRGILCLLTRSVCEFDPVFSKQSDQFAPFFVSSNASVIKRMIALAKKDSIAYWHREFPNASETELEMMYTHLSNGLMHVVVEGYDKYSKEEIIHFVSCMTRMSLSLFRAATKTSN